MLTKLNAMPAGGSSPADKKRPASEAPRKTLASKAAKIDARRAASIDEVEAIREEYAEELVELVKDAIASIERMRSLELTACKEADGIAGYNFVFGHPHDMLRVINGVETMRTNAGRPRPDEPEDVDGGGNKEEEEAKKEAASGVRREAFVGKVLSVRKKHAGIASKLAIEAYESVERLVSFEEDVRDEAGVEHMFEDPEQPLEDALSMIQTFLDMAEDEDPSDPDIPVGDEPIVESSEDEA